MRRLRTSSVALCFMILLSVASAAPADDPPPQSAPPNVLDVKEWWGTYTITVDGAHSVSRNTDGFPYEGSFSFHRKCVGNFHLNKTMSGGLMPGAKGDLSELKNMQVSRTWVGSFDIKNIPTAHVDIDDNFASTGEDPVEGRVRDHGGTRTSWRGSNDVKAMSMVTLVINPDKKTYGMMIPYDLVNSSELKVTEHTYSWTRTFDNRYTDHTSERVIGGPLSKPNIKSDATQNPNWITERPLEGDLKAQAIAGQITYDVPLGYHSKLHNAHVVIKWTLSPKPPGNEELIIMPESAQDYANWRPEASLDQKSPGGRIIFKAKLQKKGGGEPDETAKYIMFKLEQVSHEPGICINYPLIDENADQPDLQFCLEDNPWKTMSVMSDHTAIHTETDDNGIEEAYVTVSSFDYGAFGVLEARAELQSGRIVYGHIESDPNIYSLRIPKSRGDSHIADIWREHNHADGADDSDDDEDPVGNGTKGDGFSLFEEYRGYIADGGWSDMDPHKKDLFVINRVGPIAVDGFDYFQFISKIQVHVVKWEESRLSKVINFNSSPGRHSVDQHGIVVRMGTTAEHSIAIGGPGPPRQITAVEMCATYTDRMPAEDVAHELLHSCAVWHHGEGDPGKAYWVTIKDDKGDWKIYAANVDANGTPTRVTGSPIKLFSERLPDIELYPPPGRLLTMFPCPVYIAVPHGQHSGDEDCVMRYDVATCYPKGPPGEYFWIAGQETKSSKICNTNSGHDYNGVAHKPRSRYKEADTISLRGYCDKQIQVNDKGNPQPRPWRPAFFPEGYQK